MKVISIHSKVYGTREVLVDDEDYQKVCNINWYIHHGSVNGFYASSRKHGLMHRFLVDAGDLDIDHRDRNGLNNQKSNLRISTRASNCHNVPARGKSKFKGVTKHTHKYWFSRIKHNRKSHWLGMFPQTPCGELMAAIAYDIKAHQLHGDNAVLNFL